jgi:hypothetical protein
MREFLPEVDGFLVYFNRYMSVVYSTMFRVAGTADLAVVGSGYEIVKLQFDQFHRPGAGMNINQVIIKERRIII